MAIILSLAASTSSVHSKNLAWSFMKNHWTDIYARCQSGFLLPRLVKVISSLNLTFERYCCAFVQTFKNQFKGSLEGFFTLEKYNDIEV
jgi:hypothetical protein